MFEESGARSAKTGIRSQHSHQSTRHAAAIRPTSQSDFGPWSVGRTFHSPHGGAVLGDYKSEAIVANRDALVPQQTVIDIIDEAIAPLDVGEVPRGVYMERHVSSSESS